MPKTIRIASPGHPVLTAARWYVYDPATNLVPADQPLHGFFTFGQAKSWLIQEERLSLDVCQGVDIA